MAQDQKDRSKNIRDVMTSDPSTVGRDENIRRAAQIMKDQDTGVVPVVDGKKIVGMVTDRDIVVRLIAEGRDPSTVKVSDVMTTTVRSVREDASIDDVLTLMTSAEIRRVPVVNRNDEIVGIVSIGDIAKTDADRKVGKAIEDISNASPNN